MDLLDLPSSANNETTPFAYQDNYLFDGSADPEIKDELEALFDWDDSLHDSLCDDLDFKFNIDFTSDLPDVDSPILTNALTTTPAIKQEPGVVGGVGGGGGGDKILFPGDVEPLQVSSSIQTDNVLKRITQARSVLINGEKEIFGKNIIGLHCLNEIKTSPDKNCQITSTVINGKRYNIIIRPKSTSNKAPATHHSPMSTLCPSVKSETPDYLISELQDGVYDVMGNEDVVDPWALPQIAADPEPEEPEPALPPTEPPKVPPLRIKIPKKSKKHRACKKTSGYVVKNVPKKEHTQSNGDADSRSQFQLSNSGMEDSVQLDHDYCSLKGRQVLAEKNPRKDSGLESGGVSDASDNPNSPPPTHPPVSAPILAQQLTTKLIQEKRRNNNHNQVTKMATALFRAANGVQVKIEPRDVEPEKEVTCNTPDISSLTLSSDAQTDAPVTERPRKKLKLEEYLSRRNEVECPETLANELKEEKEDEVMNCETIDENPSDKRSQELPEITCDTDESIVVKKCDEIKSEVAAEALKPSNEPSKAVVTVRSRRQSRENERISERSVVVGRAASKRRNSPRSKGGRYSRVRRCSSSSTSSERVHLRRKSWSRTRRGRSFSRDRRRSDWSPRRSMSRSSSSSPSRSPRRRPSFSFRHRRRFRSRSRIRDRKSSRRSNNQSSSKKSGRSWSPIFSQREKQRQIDERRVVYVGRLEEGTTNQQLRKLFCTFGPIVDISVHFREHGDNYGFVTFTYKDDAYRAVERGHENPDLALYDICFGGRRTFCKQRYSDLDGMPTSYSGFVEAPVRTRDDSFDLLLQQAKAQLHKRKDSAGT